MKASDLHRYARDPVAFADDFLKKNELGQPFRLFDHQREILPLAFAFETIESDEAKSCPCLWTASPCGRPASGS